MEYPWLKNIFDRIQREYALQTLHHALLFYGPQGIGKRALIENLAASWLGETPQGAALWTAGNHPDVYRCEPEGAQFSIRVNTVRELLDFATQSPSVARLKVVLIPYAHRMNINAANALLKILEEPPPQTFFLLETSAPGVLPKTVLSRTAQIACRAPSQEVAEAWLQSQVPVEQLRTLMILSGGAPLCVKDWVDRTETDAILSAIAKINEWANKDRSLWDVATALQNVSTDVAKRLIYRLFLEMFSEACAVDEPRLFQHKQRRSLSGLESATAQLLAISRAEAHLLNLNPQLAWEGCLALLR